jgi:hypothetical protein
MKRRLFGIFLTLFASCSFVLASPQLVHAAPTDTTDTAPTCDAGSVVFNWLICGVIRVTVNSVDWIRDNIIVPFLQEKPLDSPGTCASRWSMSATSWDKAYWR